MKMHARICTLVMSTYLLLQMCTNYFEYLAENIFNLGLSDYHDSTRYHDSLSLFTIVIVDCLTIRIVILYEFV